MQAEEELATVGDREVCSEHGGGRADEQLSAAPREDQHVFAGLLQPVEEPPVPVLEMLLRNSTHL